MAHDYMLPFLVTGVILAGEDFIEFELCFTGVESQLFLQCLQKGLDPVIGKREACILSANCISWLAVGWPWCVTVVVVGEVNCGPQSGGWSARRK